MRRPPISFPLAGFAIGSAAGAWIVSSAPLQALRLVGGLTPYASWSASTV